MGTEIKRPPLRKICAEAPTRVDLAGGTLDIWPIHLFLSHPITINFGINLVARAEVTETLDGKISLVSQDQKQKTELSWDDLTGYQPSPQLEIAVKLLRYFREEKSALGSFDRNTGLEIKTSAQSPAGAGLGGSSTLSIALAGALATWSRGEISPEKDGEELITVARDVETTIIRVPAGLQDYYGAMYGGLQRIRWGVSRHERLGLDTAILEGLESRLLLFYSGQSRNSGINNWALFKDFIDDKEAVREKFHSIGSAAHQLEQAILKKDWVAIGRAISNEWEVRRTLATGISTDEIDTAFEKARALGASAMKICGAGGGGCFFVYFDSPSPEQQAQAIQEITSQGIQNLPFRVFQKGLEVKVDRA